EEENNDKNLIYEQKSYPFKVYLTSSNYPFDPIFNSSPKLNLNNVFSQTSYYYEDKEKFRKYYNHCFTNNRNVEKFSSFEINIEEISSKIFLLPHSGIFNLLSKMDYYSKYFDKANVNK